jgi:hypothetical protein
MVRKIERINPDGSLTEIKKCIKENKPKLHDFSIVQKLKKDKVITDEQIKKVEEIIENRDNNIEYDDSMFLDSNIQEQKEKEYKSIEVKDMGLLTKKEKPVETKLSEEDLNTIKSVFDDTFNTFDNGNEDKMKDIETVKIIIKELLAVDKHLPSTTKLNNIQVTELAQAKYLNSFFKSPIIDLYMNQFMKLKRSETKEITTNLLDGLLSIGNTSMNNNSNFDESKGILGNRWKR